jgi:hypothetical protein
VNDRDPARELAHLHADTTAAIEAATPAPAATPDDEMNGPIVLANGMWATRWHMIWRVTEERDDAKEQPSRFVAIHLDECRQWAGAQLRDPKH